MTHSHRRTGLAPFICFAATLSLTAIIPLAAQANALDSVDNLMYPGLPGGYKAADEVGTASPLPPTDGAGTLPPPPPMTAPSSAPAPAPLAVPQTDIPEPDVNIREEPQQTVEEFRTHGRPYMIKVTPRNGLPPYYMVDNDGDGTLETRVNSPSNPPATPRWVLFRW